MVEKEDILNAIEELENSPDTYGKCEKLATFYSLLNHLYPETPKYSYDAPMMRSTVGQYGDTEFLTKVARKDPEEAWLLMDELITALQFANPRLYDSVMRRL